VKIWDRRYLNKKSPDPVCNLVHPKGLSSAFFSPAGKYVVTTCNDDRLRVYDVTNMLTTRPNGTFKQVIYFHHIYEKGDRTVPEPCTVVVIDISGFNP
jgi:WD40 repeat protein